ncbi:PorV/PorQ family protein [Bacteroides sp.]|uniref:PorV/PorQ family protein n=1 Tax=Bacteroides sp. TaxID=29523 RepID=UPI0025BA5B16|nr:PorV/PorQ family protein [Bacteroides sp.]
MKKIIGILVGVSFCAVNVTAQGVLELPADARSAGMGEVCRAVSANTAAVFQNASLIAFTTDKVGVGYGYTPAFSHLQDGYRLHTIGGFVKLGKNHGLTAGFRSYRLPESEQTGQDGVVSRIAKPGEWALEAGYFYEVIKNLSLSVNLSYVSSDLDVEGIDAGDAFCFDFGASYRQGLSWMNGRAAWTTGLSLKNIGSKLNYGEGLKSSLPGLCSVGGALYLPFSENHVLECGVDIDYLLPSETKGLQGSIGAEYTFLKHGLLRAGYHLADEDKGYSNYGSVGCGVRFFHLQGDFAYLLAGDESPMKNMWQVSVGFTF